MLKKRPLAAPSDVKRYFVSSEENAFFEKLETLFTQAQVVEAIKEFVPIFEYEERGRNLDQKM